VPEAAVINWWGLDRWALQPTSLLLMEEVKPSRRRGHIWVSGKHQVTIPVEALQKAGLRVGDELRADAAGPGRIVLVRVENLIARYAGCLPSVYPAGYLRKLRDE
jgi:hypothetical protein